MTATTAPPRRREGFHLEARTSRRILLAAAAIGVLVDLSVRSRLDGFAMTMYVVPRKDKVRTKDDKEDGASG